MKLNAKTALLSHKVLLVPYEPHHVPTYHAWMEDEDLRTATASDRLTLPEEHAMQKSWREDGDKLTFIACLPPPSPSTKTIVAGEHDIPTRMLGDVNLFLYPSSDHDGGDDAEGKKRKKKVVGEVEVMIARRDYHGRGLGREAVALFLWYVGMHKRGIVGDEEEEEEGSELVGFRVKIAQGNGGSIRLFEALGFERVGGVSYFGEVELVRGVEAVGKMEREEEEEWRVLEYGYDGGEEDEAL